MKNLSKMMMASVITTLAFLCLSIPNLSATTYSTVASGNWQSPGSWANNLKPDSDNINGDTVYINHDLFLGGHDIELLNGALVVVNNCNLTTNNSTLRINSGTFIFDSGILELRNGGQVELTHANALLQVSNAEMIVDDHYFNTNGTNVLTTVCLKVGLSYVNTNATDNLTGVYAEIGADLTGPFGGNMENNSSSSMTLSGSYLQVNDGDFLNQSSSSVSGVVDLIYVKSGDLNNSANWSATVNDYHVSANVVLDPVYLPASQISSGSADNMVSNFACPSFGGSQVAVTTQSIGSGLWSDPNIWSNGVPSGIDEIIIDDAIDLDCDFDVGAAARMQINSGGSLDIQPSYKLTLNGDLQNDGMISGKTEIKGASRTMRIGDVEQLVVNTSNNITLDGNMKVSGYLQLDQGTLVTNSYELRLESNSSATAMIIDNGGQVTGDVTVERFVQNTVGSHFFSSPVSNAIVDDLSDDINIIIAPNLSTIYYYDETDDAPYHTIGWTKPANVNEGLEVTKGYSLYFDASSGKVLDVTGTANTGTQTCTLTYTDSDISNGLGTSATCPPEGWNLVGNPYPCAIDFDLVVAANSSIIENALYLWDPVSTSYRSYIDGISVPSNTSRIIASSQGFWVKAKVNNAQLTFDNSMRITDPNIDPTYYRNSNNSNSLPLIRLGLVGQNQTKETVFRFHANATAGFDEAYDAYYLPSDLAANTEFSTKSGLLTQSVNSIAPLAVGADIVVPLFSRFPTTDIYEIQMMEYLNQDAELKIFLVDKELNLHHDITQSNYAFQATDVNNTDRFELLIVHTGSVISNTELSATNSGTRVYKSENQINIDFQQSTTERQVLEIYNQLGQLLHHELLPAGQQHYRIDAQLPSPNVYYVRINSKGHKLGW